MKKTILKSVIMVLVTLFSLNANAYDAYIDGIYYNLNTENKTAEVTNNGSSNIYTGDIFIPESFEHEGVIYSVSAIGARAFDRCSSMTSVIIPNSVTSIGNYAFQYCSGLTSVTIPNSVTSISQGAFYGCSGLTSVDIPNNVTSISKEAFYGCSGLTSVDIPNSVTSIGYRAFESCTSLTTVAIPNSVTSIGGSAFNGTPWYNNQEDGLVYAGRVVYKYKGEMPPNTAIELKDGTLGIAGAAFASCGRLTSVIIPNSVKYIGNAAFEDCRNLLTVNIPNSVTLIDAYAFYNCQSITSVTIPNSVTSIGDEAFSKCRSLTSLTISNNTTIGERAFSQIGGLTSITIELADLAAWCNDPNIFSKSDISIPSSCTCYLSMDGKVIEDLIIPSNITEIDNNAFEAYNLKSITMEITDLVAWCMKPLSFLLPSSCTRYLSLNGNVIKDLVIPQSVSSIGNGAFRGCNSLTSVKVEWNRPLAGGAASFPENVKKNAPLYVPKGTAMMYMSAPGWSEFVNIMEYEDGEDAHYITIRMGDGGVLKQSVDVGQMYTYVVNADEGWEVNTLTFDGKDMTSLLLDGQFSTPVITGNSELNVVFKQKDTSVKAMPSMSEVKVYASNKSITVTGADENETVSVYGINGALVTSAVGNATFTLESGVYVVKVGEETFKVRL